MSTLPETPPPGRGGAELPYTQKGLAEAGEQPDRNLLTRAGRALQKHLARETGRAEEWRTFISERLNEPLPTTASEYNRIGQRIVEEMITDVKAHWGLKKTLTSGESVDVRSINGLGARWDQTTPPFFRTFLD